MSKISIDVEIADSHWSSEIADIEALSQTLEEKVFAYVFARKNMPFSTQDKDIFVNLRLSSDKDIHALNKQFRGMDKPTNVLTFANLDYAGFAQSSDLFGSIELGDIIISYETMKAEAAMENITLRDHYCHLLIHGLLHILGYDHIEKSDAEIMENAEVEILAQMGIENPYKDFCN